MARFYFQLHECGTIIEDDEGLDLPDLAAARASALVQARDVMSGEVRAGRLCLGCALVVQDSERREVAVVPFREAITLSGL